MPRIGIIGVGSIGGTLAHGFHDLGHTVLINDTDPLRVDALPYPEASKGDIAADCDYVIIAVPTPSTQEGGDASIVDSVLAEIRDTDAVVVLRSTMPPTSTRRLAETHDIDLVYNPEFLRDRSTVTDFFCPDRIVLAGPDSERSKVRDLLTTREIKCDTIIETREYITAELGKYAHNALFATKVSFANQMRVISEASGADPETVMHIVTADSRNTTSHLDPMLGPYGGMCLPKDLAALRHHAEVSFVPSPVLDAVHEMNQLAKEEYEYHDIKGRWPDITIASD